MPSFFDQIYLMFRGEELVVLGPRGSGKTTISTLIRTNEFTRNARATIAPEEAVGTRHPFDCASSSGRTHLLTLRRGLDVEGSDPTAMLESWKESLHSSTAIFYLVKLNRLGDERYSQLIERDTARIGEILGNVRSRKKRVATLVGTFLDEDPSCPPEDDANYEQYENQLADHDSIRQATNALAQNLERPPVFVAGSLDSQINARRLACRALEGLGW